MTNQASQSSSANPSCPHLAQECDIEFRDFGVAPDDLRKIYRAWERYTERNTKELVALISTGNNWEWVKELSSIKARFGENLVILAAAVLTGTGFKHCARMSTLVLLGELGPASKAAVPALERVLRTGEADLRSEAAIVLGRIGPDAHSAIPSLIDALIRDEYPVTDNAANALGKIGSAAASSLIDVLSHPLEAVRSTAAKALGAIGPAAAGSAVPALAKALSDSDSAVRSNAATALGQMGAAAEAALWAMVRVLQDEAEPVPVRCVTVEALGKVSPAAIPALITALKQPDYEVVARSAEALGNFGSSAVAAVPALTLALGHSNEWVRLMVNEALRKIDVVDPASKKELC